MNAKMVWIMVLVSNVVKMKSVGFNMVSTSASIENMENPEFWFSLQITAFQVLVKIDTFECAAKA